MKHKDQKFEWTDLQEIWINSNPKIHLELTGLVKEVKEHTSQLEQDLVQKDLATLKANWEGYKAGISTFEKDSIKNDWAKINTLLRKFFNFLKRTDQ